MLLIRFGDIGCPNVMTPHLPHNFYILAEYPFVVVLLL